METNLATHMSWVQARLPGAQVVETPELLLVDSGFATDTFNVVCRAQLAPETLESRIAEAITFFRQRGRPFSWWVSPSDQPEGLGQALSQAGLVAAEQELAMAASLAELPPVETAPQGLRIQQVTQLGQVSDFARVIAATGYDLAYYEAAAPYLIQPDSPFRLYIGYLEGRPVASAELCLAGGVAGLYNISTLETERRKGIGTALTVYPLLEARAEGVQAAILQASAEGQRLYVRVGFRSVGHYVEYKPVA
jgi:ribosomal protein S18 acetylase RimI-like enzyme